MAQQRIINQRIENSMFSFPLYKTLTCVFVMTLMIKCVSFQEAMALEPVTLTTGIIHLSVHNVRISFNLFFFHILFTLQFKGPDTLVCTSSQIRP